MKAVYEIFSHQNIISWVGTLAQDMAAHGALGPLVDTYQHLDDEY